MPLFNDVMMALDSAIQEKRLLSTTTYFPQPRFFSIDNNNTVRSHMNATEAVFPAAKYVFGCLREVYQEFGWKSRYDLFSIFDREGRIIEVEGDQWVIKKLIFEPTSELSPPRPKAIIALKNDPEVNFEFHSYEVVGLEPFWSFFVELNENCTTLREAELYFQYFLLKHDHNRTLSDFQQFKTDKSNSDEIIAKYENLLASIQEMVDKCIQKS